MPAAPVLLLDHTDSTNTEARRRAEAGETGPLWIVARRQAGGRGRRGREWTSEGGNLFATLLQTTRKSPAEAAQAQAMVLASMGERSTGSAPSGAASNHISLMIRR